MKKPKKLRLSRTTLANLTASTLERARGGVDYSDQGSGRSGENCTNSTSMVCSVDTDLFCMA